MEEIKLTKNEQKVLGFLCKNGRITDSEIANKMKLTVSSISRIREKLIDKKIINGFSTSINYNLLGIKCYVMIFYSVTPKWWKELSEEDVKKIMSAPQIVNAIRTSEKDFSYIVTYAFKNNIIANKYFNEIQRVYNDYLNIEKIIYLSDQSFIKNSPKDLLKIIFSKEIGSSPNINLFEEITKKNKKDDCC
ncbi:hypothetical protein C0585_01595 [Candidatus Woesearchaeota archaeon]|nr:MAG: hypothetical protein C0585_01595 [Candidatus Woesearchaeota archaeon]